MNIEHNINKLIENLSEIQSDCDIAHVDEIDLENIVNFDLLTCDCIYEMLDYIIKKMMETS
jgi:hypothetical protein